MQKQVEITEATEEAIELVDSQEVVQVKEKTVIKQQLFMRCVTWHRDSHGLFDYESRSITRNEFKSWTSGILQRNKDPNEGISFINPQKEIAGLNSNADNPESSEECLIRVTATKKGQTYELSNCLDTLEEESVNRIWQVVQRQPGIAQEDFNGYKIMKFDVIKLGRFKFRVKDLSVQAQGLTEEEIYQQELKEAFQVITCEPCESGEDAQRESRESTPSKAQCRFCWSSESTDENPCIVPCKCSGSVGFIHYACLKSWLNLKLQTRETANLTTLFWRNFECEICKYAYPYSFKVNAKIYKLVDITKPSDSGNFMVMESLPLEKNTSRTIHVLNFSEENQSFKMGRGHESEVRVNDISVSRCHAVIKCLQSGIYIQDNQSKFGTLVLLRQPSVNLTPDQCCTVQCGRTVFSFVVKEAQPPEKVARFLSTEEPDENTVPLVTSPISRSDDSYSKKIDPKEDQDMQLK